LTLRAAALRRCAAVQSPSPRGPGHILRPLAWVRRAPPRLSPRWSARDGRRVGGRCHHGARTARLDDQVYGSAHARRARAASRW